MDRASVGEQEMVTEVDALELEILKALRDAGDEPLGSVTLHFQLSDRLEVGQATIGRKLKEFDMRDLTERVGYQGRRLTEEGQAYLKQLIDAVVMERRSEAFLSTLKSNDGKMLIQVLEARRALEKEAARLATLRMDEDDADELEELVLRQREALDRGESGSYENLAFHEAIAKFSQNKVLANALHLVRDQSQLTLLIGTIRERVGGVLVHDHEEVVAAMRTRDPEAAERAMATHIDRIIEDVTAYFELERNEG